MRLTAFTGPYPVGESIGGIGLRFWELACALADAGIDVTLVGPPGTDTAWSHGRVQVTVYDEDTWRTVVETSDAVMTGAEADTPIILHAHTTGRLLIAETGVPIEQLDYDRLRNAPDPADAYQEVMDQYLLQVVTADHLLARSDVERAALYATLAALGRLTPAQHTRSRTLDHLVSLLPIGFGARADAVLATTPITARPVEFCWSGGIWDFYDTEAVCQATALLRDEGLDVRTRFLYAPPPDQETFEAARLHRAIEEYSLQDLVLLHPGPLRHSDRDSLMLATHALICLGRPGVENELCHRLRLRDALLYRTPVVVDSHGASGDWMRRLGIGLAVDTRDVRQVADAMAALTRDDHQLTACLHAIERERHLHRIEANIGPLLRVLTDHRPAARADRRQREAAVAQILARRPALAHSPLQLL
ncbi:hypothetical protein GCM10018781_60960 [Kitasatospora indigofera]|uniref:Glycosyltransferase n=1 Tax=Kitasatospora indigofera TaxID=67307 RepID=A0A919L1G9_9ACTN|nr:hypothetical protein [Kitasatospora indigofera]GHH80472.1 hypothetical protein GCM10018781_60960 [Kitasatospora indigofera]